jgi:diguanylate cyclase (GGDEF)-like protein
MPFPEAPGQVGALGRRERPPRLVLRFAIYSAIGLALAAASILVLVRTFSTAQAERSATRHARFVTQSLLSGKLAPSDFGGPVEGERRRQLDRFFGQRVLGDGTVLVELYGPDGRISYATDHSLIGIPAQSYAPIYEATGGTILSDLATLPGLGPDGGSLKVLRAYVPLPLPDSRRGPGVVAIYQDYRPIAQVATEAFWPIAGVLEVVLLALYAVLIPVLRRVTKRVHKQMEEIEFRASHDDLTGLPNRTLFRARIAGAVQAAAREGSCVAVMLLDLDRFKEINDALGHQQGDELLRELGARLSAAVGPGETFARLGGDEFGVVLPATSPAEAVEVAQRILAVAAEPFVIQGLTLDVTASLGIALATHSGQDVDALIRHADVAMYVAKDSHSGYTFYDEEHDPNDADRLALVADLRRAIERNELIVEFQPKAELASGRIVGVEALVRWIHPTQGLLRPHEFVPLAEHTGLIKPLSRFVLETSLRQWRDWRVAGIDMRVAVNLTVANLLDLELAEEVRTLLSRFQVPADRLELEVTESMIMADPFRVRQVLTRLSDMGVRLAIDDFGTGYSSLAYLKRLPVDVLKIDRSFVTNLTEDPNDATIVRSTIDLGRNLGLEVVAEGVESPATWRALEDFGCHLAQGYLVGRPTSAPTLTARLGQDRPAEQQSLVVPAGDAVATIAA